MVVVPLYDHEPREPKLRFFQLRLGALQLCLHNLRLRSPRKRSCPPLRRRQAANRPTMFNPPNLASTGGKERWPSWDPSGGVLFLAAGGARGHDSLMLVAAGCGLDVVLLLLVGLAEQRLARLTALLGRGGYLRHPLSVPPAGEADLAGEAVGLEQRFLLHQACIRRDRPACAELLFRLRGLL